MTQFNRVIEICSNSDWLTLDQIKDKILEKFGVDDAKPSIGNRLREKDLLNLIGLKKERKIEVVDGKAVNYYRLIKNEDENRE